MTVTIVALLGLLTGSVFTSRAEAVPSPRADEQAPRQPVEPKDRGGLEDGSLRETVKSLAQSGRPAPGTQEVEGKVRVEVVVEPGSISDARRNVTRFAGEVEGSAGKTVIQALVPPGRMLELERSDGIRFLRAPLRANVPLEPSAGPAVEGDLRGNQFGGETLASFVGEELAKTNAIDWHSAGFTGASAKVGIVDLFDGAAWQAAQDAGELPPVAGTFCRNAGAACNVWASGSKHGEGVAEIVHEMAPRAAIYVAYANTAADLQAAVDYFASQGVSTMTRSLTAEYDGAGDGTGPIAEVMNSAVAKGITWFNSAGNSAGRNGKPAAYWRGAWSDGDGDRWLNFAANDELMAFDCSFMNGLRWSDWGAARTDYDLYVYDDEAATTREWVGEDEQTDAGGPPSIEHGRCQGRNDIDYIAVKLYAAGWGTAGDTLEFMTNGYSVEYPGNPFSASAPASDTSSPGALSIGAVDPPLGTAIANYSSEGTTNDRRIKPDMSAASCVASFTYNPGCFNGTSAATPVAAGAGALVRDSGKAATPAQVKIFMLDRASVDRGAAGQDNVFGRGELVLPAANERPPDTQIDSGPGETSDGEASFSFSSRP